MTSMLRLIFALAIVFALYACGGGDDDGDEAEALHTDVVVGVSHAVDKDTPFTSGCTSCHGASLQGDDGPSCTSCHVVVWSETQAPGGGGGGVQTARPPVLSSIGDKTVAPGDTLTFTVRATDPDGDAVTLSADGTVGPGGNPFGTNPVATFNPSTGVFQWTPSDSQVGDYDVRFTATENTAGALTDQETIMITVTDAAVALGAQLYQDHCQSCHGAQGQCGSRSSVRGALAITISEAIGGNVGAMTSLNFLSASDIQAISDYLQTVPLVICP